MLPPIRDSKAWPQVQESYALPNEPARRSPCNHKFIMGCYEKEMFTEKERGLKNQKQGRINEEE